MADQYLLKREKLATLLFERLEEVQTYTHARKLADLVLERIARDYEDQVARRRSGA